MPLHAFDTATLPATPWKNGGGTTREICCLPAGADMQNFDWRISIATIAADGPFSRFEGIDRVITLLDGAGVHLQGEGVDHRLGTPLAPFAFSGDVALDSRLLGGSCTDFNVMVRRSRLQAQVTVLRQACDLPASAQGLWLAHTGDWNLHSSASGNTLQCAQGHGAWWAVGGEAWRASPRTPDAALLWVALTEVG